MQTGYLPGLAAFDGADPSTATWRFALEDHLGSPRAYLAQSKAAVARQDFSPYGELMRSAGLPLTIGYTGHMWDRALGQYFAPFRYYNPATARWNMRDPLGFVDGPNVYAYVAGNPVGFNDTLGLSQRVPCRTPKSKYPRGDDSVADPKRSPDDDYDYPHIPKDVYKELDKTLNRGGQPSWPHMPKSDGSPNPWKWHRRGPNYEDILKDDRNNKAHDPHFDYIRHYDNDKHNTKKWRVYPGENGLECEAVPV